MILEMQYDSYDMLLPHVLILSINGIKICQETDTCKKEEINAYITVTGAWRHLQHGRIKLNPVPHSLMW